MNNHDPLRGLRYGLLFGVFAWAVIFLIIYWVVG